MKKMLMFYIFYLPISELFLVMFKFLVCFQIVPLRSWFTFRRIQLPTLPHKQMLPTQYTAEATLIFLTIVINLPVKHAFKIREHSNNKNLLPYKFNTVYVKSNLIFFVLGVCLDYTQLPCTT